MYSRFSFLLGLSIVVGLVTKAFAEPVGVRPAAAHGELTRAGAVALIVESDEYLRARAAHYRAHVPPMPLFEDVHYDEWYAPYIEAAFEEGIITGTADPYNLGAGAFFRPSDPLMHEEALMMAMHFGQSRGVITPSSSTIDGGSWVDVLLAQAEETDIAVSPTFHAATPIGRGDFFAMMESLGIEDPSSIAVHAPRPPAPVVVQRPPVQQPRPTTTSSRPSTPPSSTPAQQQPQPTSSQPAVSQKSFAITLPTLGITDLTITHPTDTATQDGLLAPLKHGVGHLFSYPGQNGKILIYGHSSSFPWDISDYTKVFRQINKLQVGDTFTITYNGSAHTYKVSKKQTVLASDTSPYNSDGTEEVILYTCWPPDSIRERYLVHAVPTGEVAVR